MFIRNFENFKDYRKLDTPIEFESFDVVGFFPYQTASVKSDVVSIPRKIFSDIENQLRKSPIMDNKIVVVCMDKVGFGTDDFIIQFKDLYVKVGKLEDIIGYDNRELIKK